MLVSSSTIQAEVDINKALQEALLLNERCPLSFMLSGDFTLDVAAQMREVEALRQNEYFARRWWELQYLDYSWEI